MTTLAYHRIGNFDFFLKVVIVLSGCLRLIVSRIHNHLLLLGCLLLLLLQHRLLSPKDWATTAYTISPSTHEWSLRAYTGCSSNLWLRTCGLLHTWLEIVHVSLALIDLLNRRDLVAALRLWNVEVVGRLFILHGYTWLWVFHAYILILGLVLLIAWGVLSSSP